MTDFADDGGRYRLDSRIATGGMGEVWRATDTTLGRQVAVKLLKAEYADDATFRARFETEARHAAALHHPGIAAVFDFGERAATDGSGTPRPYLVMELVEGQPLSSLIGANSGGRDLDPRALRDLLIQTGEALGAAHRAGIVHRDVKPANLMVTPDGRVKVTDFGIARAADGVGITRTGAVMGTPQYLSPEQAEGRPATAASDVYALGIVAFECLAGYRPFDKESSVATALAHVREPVPQLPSSVEPDLASVITRALSKDPAERYADGAAFAAALRDPATAAIQRPRVVPAPVPVPDAGSTQVLPATPYEPVDAVVPPPATPVEERNRRRNPWPVVLVVLLLVALAVVLTLLLTGGDGEEPTDGATTPSATTPTQTETTPSETTTTEEGPATVRLDPGDFVDRPVDDVEADLRDRGFDVELDAVENDDPDSNGLVTGIDPSGDVEEGSLITVTYLDDAPEETTEPEPSETPSETPTEETPTEPAPGDGGPGGGGPDGSGPPGQEQTP
ncbi:protein kinase domain-containing protein [Nocardioides litoris]|uniref:protein kinase domain-containing protein n=1 Tax=Nocardioides litoris TaxID=1926648 RepID=UPI00111E5CE2|nr:protein kinase [Nocardioides litoris]